MKMRARMLLLAGGLTVTALQATAQEMLAPRGRNPIPYPEAPAAPAAAAKTTALSLPFFEDFTDYSLYPSAARWADSNVYINNTMAIGQKSRGVATFDALRKNGRPYDTVNAFASKYGDTLTVKPIDLSSHSPADSLYLSFFYQPEGNGFAPEPADSLMLYFQNGLSGAWDKVWTTPGSSLQPFRQVMIAVTDPAYFNPEFRFRFISKSSVGLNDDVWNLDYIWMNANRSFADTAVRDLAFTTDPRNILLNYTSMPYNQYLANAAGERAAGMGVALQNNYNIAQTTAVGYTAAVEGTGTPLGNSGGTTTVTLGAYTPGGYGTVPVYATTPPANGGSIVFVNKYYLSSPGTDASRVNDTIAQRQVFSNYLAYDDGTAEKSYFLNLSSTLPGKTAIDFRLNVPDTLRGLAVYFGQQVPTAANKQFSITVYSQLAGVDGGTADVKVYEQDYFTPQFSETINDFTNYKFAVPVVMPAGVFYIGTVQPAFSGADSLYFALDVNRVGGNHLYYNVLSSWQSSGIQGALMMRPLLGGPIVGVGVKDATGTPDAVAAGIYPNPAKDVLYIGNTGPRKLQYSITDMQGRSLSRGDVNAEQPLDISQLTPGVYLLQLTDGKGWSRREKFVKV